MIPCSSSDVVINTYQPGSACTAGVSIPFGTEPHVQSPPSCDVISNTDRTFILTLSPHAVVGCAMTLSIRGNAVKDIERGKRACCKAAALHANGHAARSAGYG